MSNIRQIEELKEAKFHIDYEINMLVKIATIAKFKNEILISDFIIKLLTDSWAIHFRNIVYFLVQKKQKPDDINAEDYFQNNEWDISKLTNEKVALQSEYDKVHKLAAHLTYKRISLMNDDDTKEWKIKDLFDKVINIYNDFVLLYMTDNDNKDVIKFELKPKYSELKLVGRDVLFSIKIEKNEMNKSKIVNLDFDSNDPNFHIGTNSLHSGEPSL